MADSDVFSSSPAHPSHIPRKRVRLPSENDDSSTRSTLKRSLSSSSTVSLPTPPPSRVRRGHGLKFVLTTEEEFEKDDVFAHEDDEGADDPLNTPSGNRKSAGRTSGAASTTGPASSSSKAKAIEGLQAVRASSARSPSPFSGTPPPQLVLTLPEEPSTPRSKTSNPIAMGAATPTRRSPRNRKPTKLAPLRDSPSNPFLSSGSSPPRIPRPTSNPGEQPTIAYVLFVHKYLSQLACTKLTHVIHFICPHRILLSLAAV